jgi:hypothetical protein
MGMTEIEFLRAEYQALVGRIGVMQSLSLSLMELVLAKDPELAAPLLESMRDKLQEKRYGGDPAVAAATLAFERHTFETEVAPFLESVRLP